MVKSIFLISSRWIFTLVLWLVFVVVCFGQQKSEAIIYCRDGSVFRGEIIQENHSGIRLVTFDQDTVFVAGSRVKKVLRSGDYLFHSNGRMHDTKGFFWAINLGFNAVGFFNPEVVRSEHFELLFGWRFNKRWTVANGIGGEFNSSDIGGFVVETTFSSYFLYGRYYLTDNRQRVFVHSRIGFGSGSSDENENVNNAGGMNWQGGLGVHFAARKRARFILSLGYYFQKTKGTQFFLDGFGNEVKIDFDMLITRPILKFGIEFR